MHQNGYLSVGEVADRFRASPLTVRRWIGAGKLPGVRIGRRWLIRADTIDQITKTGASPENTQPAYQPQAISRDRAPVYFVPMTDTKAKELSNFLFRVLRAGGAPRFRQDGIAKIILGQETAPQVFWQHLCAGIERLQGTKREDSPDGIADYVTDLTGKRVKKKEQDK
jgi:excisionase family DNA binding protein